MRTRLKNAAHYVLEDVQVRVYIADGHIHAAVFINDLAEFDHLIAYLPAALVTDERWLTDDKQAQVRNRYVDVSGAHVRTTFFAPIERLPIVVAEEVEVAA